MPALQAKYWLLTIPQPNFMPFLPENVEYIKGQLEKGNTTDYLHWQIIVGFKKKVVLTTVKKTFGDGVHCEQSRSNAADDYVWKDDTAVPNTRFCLGLKALKRASKTDWDKVRALAEGGDWVNVPADVYIRNYSSLKKIYVDNIKPVAQEKEVFVFWGRTGTGKSKRAWEEATLQAYPKSPTSIWWCGYNGHENVVIDEFRGQMYDFLFYSSNISHVLRWLDRYPTLVEVKGSSVVLAAKKIWITSNIPPEEWYPDLDEETKNALRRRFTQVIHYDNL